MKFWALFCFISLQIIYCEAIDITCNYTMVWNCWPSLQFYTCSVTNKLHISLPYQKIESVIGSHSGRRTNNDVEYFDLDEATKSEMNFFPKNLEKFFKHLKKISIGSGLKLQEIHQSDLKPFPELEILILQGNELEYLEKDLFIFNKNLRGFRATGNPISYIHPEVFDDLKGLRYLHLETMPCSVGWADENRNGVLELIKKAKVKCSKESIYINLIAVKFSHKLDLMYQVISNQLIDESCNTKLRDLEQKIENTEKIFDKMTNLLQANLIKISKGLSESTKESSKYSYRE